MQTKALKPNAALAVAMALTCVYIVLLAWGSDGVLRDLVRGGAFGGAVAFGVAFAWVDRTI